MLKEPDNSDALSLLNRQQPWMSLVVVGSPNATEVLQEASAQSQSISAKELKNHIPQRIIPRGKEEWKTGIT